MKSLQLSSEQLLLALHNQLTQIKSQQSTPLLQTQTAIPICLEYIRSLRRHLKTFRNIPKDQEINFFKHIKPRFVSEYLFNVMVYRLHSAWPMGNVKKQQEYLEGELHQINLFFEKNQQFYSYYRTNSTSFDNIYFVRGQQDIEPSAEHLLCGTDPSFHTPKDLILAQMLAYNEFQEYLQEHIQQLHSPSPPGGKGALTPELFWSESKSSLFELIYGLHLTRAINGGKSSLKTIASVVCNMFNVDVKNMYDFKYHIKMRKFEVTKFTDRMKTCLLQNFDGDLHAPGNQMED